MKNEENVKTLLPGERMMVSPVQLKVPFASSKQLPQSANPNQLKTERSENNSPRVPNSKKKKMLFREAVLRACADSILTSVTDASFSRRTSARVIDGVEGGAAERLSVSVLVHDHLSHAGNCMVSLRTQAFLFPLVTYDFPLLAPPKPFRLLTTAPVSIIPCLASKFRIRSL